MSHLKLFEPIPENEQSNMLANHMPTGVLWKNVYNHDSNLGKLVKGLAIEFYKLQVTIEDVSNELDINQTDKLLPEWEESVGIPAECFLNSVNNAKRRTQILQKVSKFGGVQTTSDFVRVALAFGIVITVVAGATIHEIDVTVVSAGGGFQFPLEFPMPFETGAIAFMQCMFDDLAPANVKVNIS